MKQIEVKNEKEGFCEWGEAKFLSLASQDGKSTQMCGPRRQNPLEDASTT